MRYNLEFLRCMNGGVGICNDDAPISQNHIQIFTKEVLLGETSKGVGEAEHGRRKKQGSVQFQAKSQPKHDPVESSRT